MKSSFCNAPSLMVRTLREHSRGVSIARFRAQAGGLRTMLRAASIQKAKRRESTVKLKIATLCVAMAAASSAWAEVIVTPELQEDLEAHEMSPETLATWMRDVLDQRGHPCSDVLSMGGQVPRTDPETRRNVRLALIARSVHTLSLWASARAGRFTTSACMAFCRNAGAG